MIRTRRSLQTVLVLAFGLAALALLAGEPPRAGAMMASPGQDAAQTPMNGATVVEPDADAAIEKRALLRVARLMPFFSFSRRTGAGVP